MYLTGESVAGRKSVEPTFDSDSSVIDICKYRYLFFVLCILLIISGIEINPGPSVASVSSSSVSSAESLLSNMSNLMTNSVSFLHPIYSYNKHILLSPIRRVPENFFSDN